MNKPITVVREETKRGLIDLINNSGLPAFVVEPIIEDILIEIKNVAKKQYEYDLEQYNSYLQSIKDENLQNK